MKDSNTSSPVVPYHQQRGTVIAHYGPLLDIEDNNGDICRCTARRSLGTVVCGDHVLWRRGRHGAGVVEKRLPRRTFLSRSGQRGKTKPVAANIDHIIIVVAPSPGINEELVDHYLVAAENTDITPLILINKIDLLPEKKLLELKQRFSCYSDIGYPVVFASAKITYGLSDLIRLMEGKISIFSGESGVGKSSLINALIPDIKARVANLSLTSGKGVHTTTTTRLYRLPKGGGIIDSPGVRAFGLEKMPVARISHGFAEFRAFAEHCRFRNCSHRNEPGCAVITAAEEGSISRLRLKHYHRMVAEYAL